MLEPSWRRRHVRRLLAGAVTVAVVAGGSVSAWALTGASGPDYRLASAAMGTVAQTLDVVGTIQPVDEATVSFQQAGTVAAVDVAAGQSVTAGQTLATLDSSALSSAMSGDQTALSTDQAKLTADEQTEAGQGASPSTPTAPTSSLAQDQQRLVSDQKTADADATQAKADLQTAQADCAPNSSACSPALDQELTDQETLNRDLSTVAQDEQVLGGLLQQEATSLASASPSGRGGSSTASGSSQVTPATIAQDQAQIDQAQAALDGAQQALDDATLVSPIAGQVAEVALTAGQSVSAGDSTAAIVVQGPDAFQVVADVTTAQLDALRVGQSALVTPDGTTSSVTGTVSSLDSLPTGSSSSDTITVSLPDDTSGLYNGANAEVSVVTGTATRALTVPTSALTLRGALYYVTELAGSTTKLVPVQVGAVGETSSQITSGLSTGTQVVLADLSLPLPTNSTNPRSIISLEGGGGAVFFRNPGSSTGVKGSSPAGG